MNGRKAKAARRFTNEYPETKVVETNRPGSMPIALNGVYYPIPKSKHGTLVYPRGSRRAVYQYFKKCFLKREGRTANPALQAYRVRPSLEGA